MLLVLEGVQHRAGALTPAPSDAYSVVVLFRGLRVLLAAGLTASSVAVAGVVGAPVVLGADDIVRATPDYTTADTALRREVLLWGPSFTSGLKRNDAIDVIAYGAGPRRATFVGSTYGRRMPSFTIAQKSFEDRWAARPVEHATQGLVGVVPISVGEPGNERSVRARVFANCRQPDGSGPRRCRPSDVQTFGGAVELVARGEVAGAQKATDVRIDSSGLSYGQLLRIAQSLRPTR